MRSLILILAIFMTVHIQAQTLSYEDVTSSTKKPKLDFTEYHAKNGDVFRIGDSIEFAEPSGGRTDQYLHIVYAGGMGPTTFAHRQSKGWKSEIKKFKIGGTKRMGYEIIAVGKTESGLANYWIVIDKAIESGEISSSTISREQAIAKLKEAKDLLELDMMSQEEYDILKEELAPIIKQNKE